MTHVDWHPVQVNEYGKIDEGDRPRKWTQVYVSLYDGYVFVTRYINSEYGFLKGDETDDLVTGIAAWAYVDMPEPYKPESKNE